jgi:CheY-like chemotaxis protein
MAERFDVIVMDAEEENRSVRRALLQEQFLSGLDDVPRIVIGRFHAARSTSGATFDFELNAPVRVLALYKTLCTALGMAAPFVQIQDMKSENRATGSRARKVLLVEDNAANRQVVRLMLEELGIEVDDVAGGLDAVARASSNRYDVILMDVRMPDCDGLEATRRIRANRDREPPVIIALTANVMRGEEERCREAGMDGYLPKPLRLNALAAALDRFTALRRPT